MLNYVIGEHQAYIPRKMRHPILHLTKTTRGIRFLLDEIINSLCKNNNIYTFKEMHCLITTLRVWPLQCAMSGLSVEQGAGKLWTETLLARESNLISSSTSLVRAEKLSTSPFAGSISGKFKIWFFPVSTSEFQHFPSNSNLPLSLRLVPVNHKALASSLYSIAGKPWNSIEALWMASKLKPGSNPVGLTSWEQS